MSIIHPSAMSPAVTAEVEPPVRSVRSQTEKIRLVQEYDAYPAGAPERGALLRREGLYTSHMAKWRKLLPHAGTPAAPTPPQVAALSSENERLRLELARVQARLSQAETIIDVHKKVALLLGQTLPLHNEP